MTNEERIALVEAELAQCTQQINAWRERQLMAQGALNVLRVIASESANENNCSDPAIADGGDGSGGESV